MKKDGNYHLVPMNKIGAEARSSNISHRMEDKAKLEERILEELEFKLFKEYKKFLSTVTSSETYFVMGEAVISEQIVDMETILFTSEAHIYEVREIQYNRPPSYSEYRSTWRDTVEPTFHSTAEVLGREDRPNPAEIDRAMFNADQLAASHTIVRPRTDMEYLYHPHPTRRRRLTQDVANIHYVATDANGQSAVFHIDTT